MGFDVAEYSKKRKEQQGQTGNSENTTLKSFDVNYYSKYRNVESVGESITNRINKWIQNNNVFIDNYNKRYESGNEAYRADSSDWLSTITTQKNNFDKEAESIKSTLEQYKEFFEEDWLNSVYEALDGNSKVQSDIITGSTEDSKFWSSFKTEDDYNKWLEDKKYKDGLKAYDLGVGDVKIADWKNLYDSGRKIQDDIIARQNYLATGSSGTGIAGYGDKLIAEWKRNALPNESFDDYLQRTIDSRKQQITDMLSSTGYVNLYDLEQGISKEESYYKEAQRYQEVLKLHDDAVNAEDFATNNGYVSYKSDNVWDKLWGKEYDVEHEYINDADGFRSKYKDDQNAYNTDNAFSDGESQYEIYDYIEEEEKAIYNYYYNTQGKDKAKEYLNSIQDTLQQRKAQGIVENIGDNGFLKAAFAIYTGLDQWVSGVKNLDNFIMGTEADTTTAVQYAGAEIRENLDNPFWQGAWDLGVTISNQLPSILVGSLTGGTGGLITMGSSVLGNSYAEMRNLGYDENQSRAYAVLVTAAELGLEKVIGGYKALGGDLSHGITEFFASKVDNAVAKLAIRTAGSMLGEGIEEALQSVLEPTFKGMISGDTYDVDWSEVIYSGILGALSAGVLEGVPNSIGTAAGAISNAVNTYQTGKAFQAQGGDIDRVASYIKENGGTKFSADSVAYKLAGKVDAKSGAYKIGKLLNEANATLTEMNKSDIRRSLERKGIKGKTADLYINALASVVNGVELTQEQITALNANPNVAKTFEDVIINQNSTVNQRMQGYNEAARLVLKGNNTTAETAQNGTVEASTGIPSDESQIVEENGNEGGFSYNPEGKTIYNNQDVSVEGISSIKDGEVFVRLDNGEEVNAKDVSFSTKDEALMYEMVADLGVSPSTAMSMMATYNKGKGTVSAEDFRVDAPLAYKYGTIGYVKGLGNLNLTTDQKTELFGYGVTDAKAKVEAAQTKVERVKNAQSSTTKGKGKVHLDNINEKSLNERQKASIKALGVVGEALGVDIHIFESSVGENGKRMGANGWYDTSDNSIHIDLYAGASGESTMLFTAAHELTHFIREWSPAKFKAFADFLIEQYGGKGVSVEKLVQRQIEKAKQNGRNIDYDTAYEEVIADSCEAMLTDSNAIEKLAKLKEKDKTLWDKIKSFISNLVARITKAYENLNPDSVEANYVREMKDAAEKLQALWTEALLDAGDAYSTISAEKTLAENGIVINSDTNSASLMSVRDVLSDEQRDKVSTALATRFDVTKEEALDWIKAETSMASLILNPKYSLYLDYTADPNEVAIKQNSDYPQGTVDFSPICAKRREFTSVMNNILRVFPNHVFAATDLAKIRSIMQEEGMTIPCGICYVEDRRQLDTIVAQNFIDSLKLYREGSKTRPDGNAFNTNQLKGLKLTDGDSYTPSVYELVSLEGLNVLKEKNPNMAEAWVKFNNARGMQSVRLLANEAEYKRQILKYSKSTVKSKNDKGGLRVYSFSDAEMFHLIDIIQVITDSATVGLSLQGYTKVNEYAKTVKDTGEKLNRSLIPKGELGYHLENGKVVLDYDTVEGIDINHPDFFDNKDNPNIGNITIGVSDVQIRAAMVSDFVDQIIPFHTGQSEEVLGEKGISTWSNYKDFQTEKDIATGKVSDHQINIYTEVLQVLEKEGTPITKRTFVEKFIQVCKENNLTPRFSQFLNTNENGEYVYTEGFHKFLVDFKTFAQTEVGEYLPQRPVKPIFDDNYITKILKDYVKSQKVKDAEIAKNMPKVIERITNEIVKPSEKKFSDRDSAGNQLTEDQAEFFKDSKVRDIKGRLQVVYHGTTSEFNTFKRGDIGYHFGSYAQARNRLSYQGGKKRYIKAYLDIKNPLVVEHDSGSWHGNYAAGMLLTWGDFNSNPNAVERLQEIARIYDTRKSDVELKNFLKSLGYDGIQYLNTHESDFGKESYSYIAFDSNQVKEVTNLKPTSNPDIRYSDRDLAPTFYSQMGKVVEGMKQDKFAANSVISMLRGRGIKAEEIRWSGIATWLEGKKSVTKQELQEFIAGSQLQIGEQMSGNDIDLRYNVGERSYTLYDGNGNIIDTYTYNEFIGGYVSENTEEIYSGADELEESVRYEYGEMSSPRWSQYKLDGGTNYRELVFTLPNSTYTNRAMKAHWGQDAEGVLVHARIQDFDVDGKKMLFIEELQSDWHNEGHSKGYSTKEYEDAVGSHDKLYNEYKKLDLAFHKYVRSNDFRTDPDDVRKKKHDWLRRKVDTAQKKYLDAEKVVNSLKEKGAGDTPDAPFKDTYHEYVLKRLLRMAAEQGYDSIGWTPADIQVKRWSDEYAEGYRIEYDQDMPKFMKKYGRQWGAKVDKTKAPNGEDIWSMGLTDSMKGSVLHEGQVLYSLRGTNKDGIEVYETSEETKELSYKDRQKAFLDLMKNQYRGRTAKFIRNGHAYYARFEEADVNKNIYGDKKSDHKGWKAKVNVGADGNIFELVENAQYKGSEPEKGKKITAHRDVGYWDYFIKTVQIDNKVFDLLANVRKKGAEGYVYSIQLKENKKVEASPSLGLLLKASNRMLNASTDDIVPQKNDSVNSFLENSENKFSDRDPDSVSNRTLLANALETAAQNDIERNKLAQYKQKIELIDSEEQQLHKLREQIKELSFARGRRDSEKIRSLQFEANQAANRINTYDRQLLTLEASKPLKAVLEREKKLAYEKAEKEGVNALMAYKEKTAKTTRELITRYQESRTKAVEGRHKTEYRHKIKDVVSKLNQLLLRPTKDKHIKEGLKTAVAEALSVINMDTVGAEERLAKLDNLIAKANDPNVIAELTATRDRIELQGENLKDKLTALQTAYENIKNSTDPDLVNAYQEPVMNAIKNVVNVVGNTSIRDMTLTQLDAVYEMYSMILHTVRTANKAFKAKKGETITQISEAVNDEVRKVGKEKFQRNPIAAYLRKVGWTLLKPFTAFRTIGSDTFTGLFKELRNGEDVYYVDINEAKEFVQNQYKKHNFKSWDMKQTKTFTAKSGKTFTLTLEQMMSLYAYSHRTQAHDHIIEGGIVLEDSVIETKNKLGIPVKYTVDTKSAFNISDETLDQICDSLTADQRNFVDEMQAYLSDVMGAKGNEVSMELLGVKLFKEKFYFPLKSSKYYMGFKPEEAGEIKLKNPAFSKETVQYANNPVVLKNFTDVWATHVNDMSMYHSFVLPLEDFTRVYNYKTRTDALVETMSTEATIANAYGEGATQYIRNFLKSLNGGVRIDGVAVSDKMISLAKKGAVLGSASVMIQQPSAVMRAMALINPKYFVTSTAKSLNLVKHNKDWAELKQYAPIAGIKEMGRFDIGMGQSTVKWIKDQATVMEKADEVLSKAPALMDEITWVSIWQAVKKEVASTNKGLVIDSEAFLQQCGERFTEVVSLTQVYDSVFSRSDIMRNANPMAKMLTSFMAEPSTTLNMLLDSMVQGKRSGSLKGFVKTTAGATGAIVGSVVLNAALKSIITAMRDDDEDESYIESYFGGFVGNTLDGLNPLTYIPFVKDVWSIFQGYDVERMDMALFSDLQKAIDAMDSENKTDYEKWSGLVGAIASFFGVPIKNVERDIRGAYNTIKSFIEGEETTGAGIQQAIKESVMGKKDSNSQQLYDAIINGDQAQIDRVKDRFEDQDAINSAIRQALRDNDSRIKEAAQAKYDGDMAEYKRIAKEIIAEGNFDQDNVVMAINAELNAIQREESEAGGTTEDSSETEADKVTSIYKASDVNIAFESGDTELAKEIIADLINTKITNGMDEQSAKSSVRSSMTSYWKPLYKEAYKNKDSEELARIRKILSQSGLYGRASEVVQTVREWLKEK